MIENSTTTKTTLGFEQQDCIHAESNFSSTIFHNVCTGETYNMPTGVYDYMIGVPLFVIVCAVALFAVVAVIKLITD